MNVTLGGLHGDVSKEKLDLLKFASRIMAEAGTGSAQIMWRQTWNVHVRSGLLDNVLNRLF